MTASSAQAQVADLPRLAEIKDAAEKGDARSQVKLGDAYASRFDYFTAARWYRLAAEKGAADAQWCLGTILLGGKPTITKGGRSVPKDLDGAIKWIFKAAIQGHTRAQVDLGHCCSAGVGVRQDNVEAYKWYSLAAKANDIWGPVYRDPLILKLTADQIAEGQRRVADFLARAPDSQTAPEPASLGQLTLKGIMGPPGKRLAIITNRTFAAGEEAEIKVGGQSVRVRCLEIKEASVVVGVSGYSGSREIFLPH